MEDSFKNFKYVAIKPKGFKHYIWFETKNTIDEYGTFTGKDGWGKGGARTSIKCKSSISDIDGFIYSDELQYSE